ncbi:TlpA family protein disulfide reductase [Streptosporangium sp. NPDC001559]|uniref:TlpA family protein disulfide reductase n=1 Tax=Streptosporangium sp. NPDC001559 TaxID=3366187 RepID=UPI0036EED60F
MSAQLVFVIPLGLLGILNLALVLGVIRRLREHSRLLAARPGEPGKGETGVGALLPAVGRRPADFTTVTVDGERISRDRLSGDTLVGFFSVGCAPCAELEPEFVRRAGGMPAGREQALAVVVGEETGDTLAYVARLSAVARVVVEPAGGPVSAAFNVTFLPVICVLDAAGAVAASGFTFHKIPEPLEHEGSGRS